MELDKRVVLGLARWDGEMLRLVLDVPNLLVIVRELERKCGMRFQWKDQAAASLEHRAKERALVAEKAASLFGVLERRLALGIVEGLRPVLLVGRE